VPTAGRFCATAVAGAAGRAPIPVNTVVGKRALMRGGGVRGAGEGDGTPLLPGESGGDSGAKSTRLGIFFFAFGVAANTRGA
jgi:hypothetical protein